MRVTLGTQNPIKVRALSAALDEHELKAEIISLKTSSGVSEQPKNLQETFAGAEQRARGAFDPTAALSFGIEDGLFESPRKPDCYMNICVACMFDGSKLHFGCSSCFEYPAEISRLVFSENLDISQALRRSGLTKDAKIGEGQGAIGLLSQGRIVRVEYTKQALRAVLINLRAY